VNDRPFAVGPGVHFRGSALGFVVGDERVTWAEVAAALGYADQSHMIAEFREFSSLTPQQMTSARVFHPFILNSVAGRSRGT
jgi:AraC-like DNA-binding protein